MLLFENATKKKLDVFGSGLSELRLSLDFVANPQVLHILITKRA